MDKYEYNVKSDQIKKLYNRKEYGAAASIADEIDWTRVKDNKMIGMVADIYEAAKQYKKAKDVLLIAYERSSMGRQLAYKLTILALRTKNFVEADEFYQDFVEMSPSDVSRYLLKYRIAKAKGEDIDVLISILEAYIEVEVDERWQYELAKLYHEAGADDKCIAACDELELWFKDGKYVDKAKELKRLITGVLEDYENRYSKVKKVKANKGSGISVTLDENGEVKYKNISDESDEKEENNDDSDSEENIKETANDELTEEEQKKKADELFEEEQKKKNERIKNIASDIVMPKIDVEKDLDIDDSEDDEDNNENVDEKADELEKDTDNVDDSDEEASESENSGKKKLSSIGGFLAGAFSRKSDAEFEDEDEEEDTEDNKSEDESESEKVESENKDNERKNERPRTNKHKRKHKKVAKEVTDYLDEDDENEFKTEDEKRAETALKAAIEAADAAQKAADLAHILVEEARVHMNEVKEASRKGISKVNPDAIKETDDKEADKNKKADEVSTDNNAAIENSATVTDDNTDVIENNEENPEGELLKTAEIDVNEIKFKIPDARSNMYDTANIQEALAESMKKLFGDQEEDDLDDEFDEDEYLKDEIDNAPTRRFDIKRINQALEQRAVSHTVPLPPLFVQGENGQIEFAPEEEEKQIDGQLDINDIMNNMDEEKSKEEEARRKAEEEEARRKAEEEEARRKAEEEEARRKAEEEEARRKAEEEEARRKAEEEEARRKAKEEEARRKAEEEEARKKAEEEEEARRKAEEEEARRKAEEEEARRKAEEEEARRKAEEEEARRKAEEEEARRKAEEEEARKKAEEEEARRKAEEEARKKAEEEAISKVAIETKKAEEALAAEVSMMAEADALIAGLSGTGLQDTGTEINVLDIASRINNGIESSTQTDEGRDSLLVSGVKSVEEKTMISPKEIGKEIEKSIHEAEERQQAKNDLEDVLKSLSYIEEDEDKSNSLSENKDEVKINKTGIKDVTSPLSNIIEDFGEPEETLNTASAVEPVASSENIPVVETTATENTAVAESDVTSAVAAENTPAAEPETISEKRNPDKIPAKLRSKFNDFAGTETHEKEIAAVLDKLINEFDMDGTSKTNNVIVTGSTKIGKTTLAVDIIKAVNEGRNREGRRVAKVKASVLNKGGVEKTMTRTIGVDLIIEQAGNLMPITLNDLMAAMKGYTEEKLFILEDDKAAIDRLLVSKPELKKFFNNRIDITEMEIVDMVKIARDYAREQFYDIDEIGELALSAKLDELSGKKPEITIEDIEDVVDDAIDHANRLSIGNLFGKLHKNTGEYKMLSEQDFM